MSPSDIAEAVGASRQAVSNQLQHLADERIVHARRDGQRMLYRIDPCVPGPWTSASACFPSANDDESIGPADAGGRGDDVADQVGRALGRVELFGPLGERG